MDNKFKMLAAYWYNRPENLQNCTDKFLKLLLSLNEHNSEMYGKWFGKASSKKKSLEQPVIFEQNNIQKILSKKSNSNDFPETCFSASLWNGKSNAEDVVQLSVSLGSKEKIIFSNNCIIEIGSSEKYQSFYQLEVNKANLIGLVNELFEPKEVKINGIKF